jgi:hypothetical protein
VASEHPLHIAEGGFAIRRGPEKLESSPPNAVAGRKCEILPGSSRMEYDGLFSAICDEPETDNAPRTAELFEPWPNTHLLHPCTVIPLLRTYVPPGNHILRCRVEADAV